jgi:adenylylsulfate kinase
MKILIMGLPGSGKSTFAEPLARSMFGIWINADKVREKYDDWDFSTEGRIRQSQRMKHLSDGVVMAGGVAVADFICPTEETRKEFDADFTIWMATIGIGKYEDTNRIFIEPENYDIRIEKWIDVNQLYNCLDGFNPGIKDTLSFSRELTKRLAKL